MKILLCFLMCLTSIFCGGINTCGAKTAPKVEMAQVDKEMLDALQSLYVQTKIYQSENTAFLNHIHTEAERIRNRYGYTGGIDGSEYIDLKVINTKETERDYDIVTFNCTAYCLCSICCGKWANGITASGSTATAGRTIAASKTYAFGTEIEINGVVYIVEDRGGAIKGNKLDIYFDSHSEALQFGRQTLEGKVYK